MRSFIANQPFAGNPTSSHLGRLRACSGWGIALHLGVVLSLAAGGCSKESEPVPEPEPLPKAEVDRARTACASYVERVCSCAGATPDNAELAEECQLAKSRPQALEIHLGADGAEGLESVEQHVVKREVRRIANGCFEADAKLDPAVCPKYRGKSAPSETSTQNTMDAGG